jgi:hypothetical protein
MEVLMGKIVKAVTPEEAVLAVLENIEAADPSSPAALSDHLTRVGLLNRFHRDLALRALRAKLRPPEGSHRHLTEKKLWAREREQWAKDWDLVKVKPHLEFAPETEQTTALVELCEGSEHVPETSREAVRELHSVLARRANRKLDETSLTLVTDSVEDLLYELEDAGKLIEEKEKRILQAERHNEQLRQTNERLLAIMEKLAPGATGNGQLTVAPAPEHENGSARPRSN